MSNNRHCMGMLKDLGDDGRFIGVGLDLDFKRISPTAKNCDGTVDICKTMVEFTTRIINDTHDIACAYLINPWFPWGEDLIQGSVAMRKIVDRIHAIAPRVPILMNSSVGDVGHANLAIIRCAFDQLDMDGITVNPYFGPDAFHPFLRMKQKGFVVVCQTSNPGAEKFQRLEIGRHDEVPLSKNVAHEIATYCNANKNCALQFGVRCADGIKAVREDISRDIPIFVQGVGPQSPTGEIDEGDVKGIILAGGDNTVMCSARGIIFSQNPRQTSTQLNLWVTKYREEFAVKVS
jgi:orotidine-5'-phosphate decarboxylase